MTMVKGGDEVKRLAVLVLLVIVLIATSGCDAFRRGFQDGLEGRPYHYESNGR